MTQLKKIIPLIITLIIGFVAGLFYCKQSDEKPFLGQFINYRQGVALADTFKTARIPFLRDCVMRRNNVNNTYEETRSIWYSYDEIQGFLNTMLKTYPNSQKKLGIRIYFGAYGKEGIRIIVDSNEKKDTINKHNMTTFFVATLKQARNSNPAMYVDSDMIDKSKGDKSTWTFLGVDPYNHGTLCPPQKDCGGTAF